MDAAKLSAVMAVPSLKAASSRIRICQTQPSVSICTGSSAASSGRM